MVHRLYNHHGMLYGDGYPAPIIIFCSHTCDAEAKEPIDGFFSPVGVDSRESVPIVNMWETQTREIVGKSYEQ
jgi:hypothetical protein